MKNTIFLDTGVIGLYQSNHEEIVKEIKTKITNHYKFISSELNYIEIFNHLCREKGKINAQIIMENLRRGNISLTLYPLAKIYRYWQENSNVNINLCPWLMP